MTDIWLFLVLFFQLFCVLKILIIKCWRNETFILILLLVAIGLPNECLPIVSKNS